VYKRFEPPVPGLAFMGYQRLPGEPLYREALDQARDIWVRDDLAVQLAGFLRALHTIPLTEVPAALHLPRMGASSGKACMRKCAQNCSPPCARMPAASVTSLFEGYLDDPALQEFIPCLRHGDFGGSNILWDPAKGQITGVVDFSYCAPGDPAVDLAGIWTMGK
jgi:aminoglycoside 2''-phosphotransferase